MLTYNDNVLKSSSTVLDTLQYQPIILKQQDNVCENFEKFLYRNSRVCRIVLGKQVKQQTKINFDQWYTVSLKFVTEMGLPSLLCANTNNVTCQLLEQKNQGYFSESNTLCIQYRQYLDPWKTSGSEFDFQYRITTAISNKEVVAERGVKKEFFIRIFVANEKSLSLCIGPFQQTIEDNDSGYSEWEDTNDGEHYKMYRAIPIISDDKYSLLQEVWDLGTPGKLWDSALVMNTVLKKLFGKNKNFLCNKTIMDLSAGIGSVGLAIAQSCQIYKVTNSPKIVLTDLEEALPLMRSNQQLNAIQDNNVSIQSLRWGSKKDADKILSSTGTLDYIFVSDVLYNVCDFPALISTLRQMTFDRKRTAVYLGYKPRGLNAAEENIFFHGCSAFFNIKLLSLNVFIQELDNSHSSSLPGLGSKNNILEETGVCVYKLTRK